MSYSMIPIPQRIHLLSGSSSTLHSAAKSGVTTVQSRMLPAESLASDDYVVCRRTYEKTDVVANKGFHVHLQFVLDE